MTCSVSSRCNEHRATTEVDTFEGDKEGDDVVDKQRQLTQNDRYHFCRIVINYPRQWSGLCVSVAMMMMMILPYDILRQP